MGKMKIITFVMHARFQIAAPLVLYEAVRNTGLLIEKRVQTPSSQAVLTHAKS
jgi:hypothetical protein